MRFEKEVAREFGGEGTHAADIDSRLHGWTVNMSTSKFCTAATRESQPYGAK